jgi:hypothetical protein
MREKRGKGGRDRRGKYLDLLLDLLGLAERRRFGLADREADRERDLPPLLGGDRLGGVLQEM